MKLCSTFQSAAIKLSFCGETINPPFNPQQARERSSHVKLPQEVTDTAEHLVYFQNKTPSAAHFVLLNGLQRAMMYARMHMFFSPEPRSKNKYGKGELMLLGNFCAELVSNLDV